LEREKEEYLTLGEKIISLCVEEELIEVKPGKREKRDLPIVFARNNAIGSIYESPRRGGSNLMGGREVGEKERKVS